MESLKNEREVGISMPGLWDMLYTLELDEGESAYLSHEERQNYEMALCNSREIEEELIQHLPEQEQELLRVLLCNREEAREAEDRLTFRRGLVLGLKLGVLAGQ